MTKHSAQTSNRLLDPIDRISEWLFGLIMVLTFTTADNFFYNWSEFAFSPTDWFRGSLVAQRTKAYETDLDIQRGLLLGLSYKGVDFTTYLFNFGWDALMTVFAIGVYW